MYSRRISTNRPPTRHDTTDHQSSLGHRLASTAHPALAPEDEAQLLESKVRRIRARMLQHQQPQQQQLQRRQPPAPSSSLAVGSAGGDGSPALPSLAERGGGRKGGGLGRVRIFATTWNMGGGACVRAFAGVWVAVLLTSAGGSIHPFVRSPMLTPAPLDRSICLSTHPQAGAPPSGRRR